MIETITEDQCSTESFSFACSCWKSSLNHGFDFIRAAALIISSKELLSIWMMKFYFCIDHSHSLKMKLRMYVAHEKVQSLVNILAKSFRTNLNMISERNDLEIIWWNHKNQSVCCDSHYISVLTISDSYDEHLENHVQQLIQLTVFSNQKKVIEKTVTQCDIVWKIIYRDEFHKEKQETAETSTLIHQINKNQVIWILPTLWFLSDTLFEKELSDLQAYLALLKYFKWIDNFIYSSYTADKVMKLSKKFDRLIKHTEISQQHQNFIMKFSNLLAVFMIQRTSQTNWFDQDLLDFFSHEVCDIRCSIDLKYAEYFRDFQAIIQV